MRKTIYTAVLLSCLFSTTAWGATYCVRADGVVTAANKANAAYACSENDADKALSMAEFRGATFSALDRVEFTNRGGQFDITSSSDNLVIPSSGGGVGTEITYVGETGYAPVLDGAGSSTYMIEAGSNDYIKIQNFTIQNFDDRGIHFNGGTGIIISNNTLTNGRYGIDCTSSESAIIHSNTLSTFHVASGTAYGISLSSTNNSTAYGNIISDICNYVGGVCLGGQGYSGLGIAIGGEANGNIVKQNYISGCYKGIYDGPASTVTTGNKIYYNVVINSGVNSIDSQSTSSTVYEEIYNNTIWHDPIEDIGHAISCQVNCINAKIGNNIVYTAAGTTLNGIQISGNYASVYLDHNLVYGPEGANLGAIGNTNYTTLSAWKTAVQADEMIFDLDGTASQAEAHSLSADPLFVGASDYHLQSGSSAKDAGKNVGLDVDYEGKALPIGAGYDLGAYEYYETGSIRGVTSMGVSKK